MDFDRRKLISCIAFSIRLSRRSIGDHSVTGCLTSALHVLVKPVESCQARTISLHKALQETEVHHVTESLQPQRIDDGITIPVYSTGSQTDLEVITRQECENMVHRLQQQYDVVLKSCLGLKERLCALESQQTSSPRRQESGSPGHAHVSHHPSDPLQQRHVPYTAPYSSSTVDLQALKERHSLLRQAQKQKRREERFHKKQGAT